MRRKIRIRRHAREAFLCGGLLLSAPLLALDIPGQSEWGKRVVLSTPVSGMVEKVHVAAGDEVAQGATLLELDQREIRSRLAAARSRHKSSRLLHQEAQRELERTLELYDRTLISEHERQLAEIEAGKAEVQYRQTEADLAALRLQQEYSRIVAPFGGRVLAIHVQPGQAVINRFEAVPLVTLADHNSMRASAEVDPRTLRGLKPGDRVQVGIRGVWLEASISRLGYDAVDHGENGARYLLEARFNPSEDMGLRSAEALVIRLPDE